MKSIAALALVGFSLIGCMSAAQAADGSDRSLAATQYTYGTKLDIAKVVNVSPIPDVCGVVPATMTYFDHQGQEHKIEYRVMGNGCQPG
jgi:hypothetical protein